MPFTLCIPGISNVVTTAHYAIVTLQWKDLNLRVEVEIRCLVTQHGIHDKCYSPQLHTNDSLVRKNPFQEEGGADENLEVETSLDLSTWTHPV